MSELVNDSLRSVVACGLRTFGAIFTLVHRIRIYFASFNQERLRRKYGLSDETPVCVFDNNMEVRINAAGSRKKGNIRFATTSGSTGMPKRILFTKARIRMVKIIFSDFYLRCCWEFSISRTSLYVFSSLNQDESLTSMLLEEQRLPSYFTTLQAPYRVQSHPKIRDLRAKYGDAAVRLWILTLSNPSVLYSTNPSTISTFFDELRANWEVHSRLIRDWCQRRTEFDPVVCRIARRISSKGSTERLIALANQSTGPSLKTFAPATATYICWTGGYVKPFLERLEKYLPSAHYRLIPMYSMSTETVETTVDLRNGSVSFLPLAPGVLYEFREADHGRLLKSHELEAGHSYSMIVSDGYGLRRYDTRDVFLCRKKVGDLPDLCFQRRRNLEYSFTGEKLTATQVVTAFERIRSSKASPLSDQFLTCIPAADPVPHYKIVVVGDPQSSQEPLVHLSSSCDRLWSEMNCEYKTKRDSGRLGPVQAVTLTRDAFVKLAYGSNAESWEAQFKFLPLYVQTWEEMTEG